MSISINEDLILDFIKSLDVYNLIENIPIYIVVGEFEDRLIIEFKDFMYFDVFTNKEKINIDYRFCRDVNVSMFDNYINLSIFLKKNIGLIKDKIENIFINNRK